MTGMPLRRLRLRDTTGFNDSVGGAKRWGIAARIVLACSMLAPLQAGQPKQIELGWNDLASAVGGRKIRLVVPPGVRLEGRLESVRSDALMMQVRKSSDRTLIGKGYREIPRSSVSTVQVVRKGCLWRTVFTSVGVVVGLASATALAIASWGDPGPGAATVALVGFPVGGYFVGNKMDRNVTRIVLVSRSSADPAGPEAEPGHPRR